jgi:TolB-like protein
MRKLLFASRTIDGHRNLMATAASDNKPPKRKDKVRSAWISFVSRILAQVIGASATIVLGLMFMQRHQPSVAAEHDPIPVVSVPIAAATPDARVLAVLPLQDFSSHQNSNGLADAMTDELITDLAQIPGLRVISRTTSASYKHASKPLRLIAGELGVRWIVEGSLVRSGGRIRVTAQLIDAKTDQHRWARSYVRLNRSLLSVQANMAAAIARDVRGALAEDER